MEVQIHTRGAPSHHLRRGATNPTGAPFRPVLSITRQQEPSRIQSLHSNGESTKYQAMNGTRSWESNAMDLEDGADEMFSQAMDKFERQAIVASLPDVSDPDPKKEGLYVQLEEKERELQDLRAEAQRNLGEIHILRDYLSQQEASEKENVRIIEEKHQKYVDLVMQELHRAKKEAESLHTQLKFKERDVEEAQAKLKDMERQLRCHQDNPSNQPKKPRLSLPEKVNVKPPDTFPQEVSFDMKEKTRKNILGSSRISGKANTVHSANIGTQCSISSSSELKDECQRRSLANQVASIKQKQFILNGYGVECPQLFLQKLLSAAESDVYNMMSPIYLNECKGDLLTLQKHPIVVSSGITGIPCQTNFSRSGKPAGTTHQSNSLLTFVLTKSVAPKKHLNFASPINECSNAGSPLSQCDPTVNLQEVLGQLAVQRSRTLISPLACGLSHSDSKMLQMSDPAELQFLPFLEKCLQICTMPESTVSSSSRSGLDSLGMSPLSTDDSPDPVLVCRLNCLLVLKTLVDYSPSVCSALLTQPPRLSDFTSVSSSFSSGRPSSADSNAQNDHACVDVDGFKQRTSTEPMETTLDGLTIDLATSTPTRTVPTKQPAWNKQELSLHVALGSPRFLKICQKNTMSVTPPIAGFHPSKIASAPPIGKEVKYTPTQELSLSAWGKHLADHARSGATSDKSWPSGVSIGSGSRQFCSRGDTPIEDCASRLLGDVMLLATPKQPKEDTGTTVHLLVPVVCLEIFKSLASTCMEAQVDRFLPLLTRGILGSCIATKQYVLLKLVSTVLLCFSKSEKMTLTLKNHFSE